MSEKFKLHKYQDEAFQAIRDPAIREIALISGIQGGKTIFGAIGMRELTRLCRVKDANFVVGAPSYIVMEQATLPTFKKIFTKHLGHYHGGLRKFELAKGGSVFFRTATDPDQVEGIPDCAGGWIDEAGKCGRLFKINMLGRVARLQGKMIYTSTPYALNWLYRDVVKAVKTGEREDIFLTEFNSAENPTFPRDEFERQRKILDARTFRRKYMGVHERMEGLVYESISRANYVQSFSLPQGTQYYCGVDFGFAEGHEFAIIVRAVTPEGIHYDISEFKQSGLSPNDQVAVARAKQAMFNVKLFLCDPARPDIIQAFNQAGLPSVGFHEGRPAFKGINAGIEKHVEIIKTGTYRIFSDQCPALIDEYETYAWPSDSDGAIKREVPVPLNDHLMDATRYATVGTMHLKAKPDERRMLDVRTYEVDAFNPKRAVSKKSWESY